MALLEVANIDVHYGAIHALRGVSFAVEERQIVTLIGANGAGKTTTLRAVSALVPPSGGTVRYDGAPTAGLKPNELVQRRMAHAPEGRGIFPALTVTDNLKLGAYLRTDQAGIAADLEKQFGLFSRLRERATQVAGTLSGGEQQMLAIARALMSRPKLLLLDEPSLGLAPQVVQLIFRIIREVNEQDGVAILLVEQNAHLALGMAHRGYVLETGTVILEGSGRELLASEAVRKAYLGE
jgi:branched-chain amino acid transport system ATP-binding protein